MIDIALNSMDNLANIKVRSDYCQPCSVDPMPKAGIRLLLHDAAVESHLPLRTSQLLTPPMELENLLDKVWRKRFSSVYDIAIKDQKKTISWSGAGDMHTSAH
jgi:hypothetical protein